MFQRIAPPVEGLTGSVSAVPRWAELYRRDGFVQFGPHDLTPGMLTVARNRDDLAAIDLAMRREDGTRCKETFYSARSFGYRPAWVESIIGSSLGQEVSAITGESLTPGQIMLNHYWQGHYLARHTDGQGTSFRGALIMNVGPSEERALALETPSGDVLRPILRCGDFVLIHPDTPHSVDRVKAERRTLVLDFLPRS